MRPSAYAEDLSPVKRANTTLTVRSLLNPATTDDDRGENPRTIFASRSGYSFTILQAMKDQNGNPVMNQNGKPRMAACDGFVYVTELAAIKMATDYAYRHDMDEKLRPKTQNGVQDLSQDPCYKVVLKGKGGVAGLTPAQAILQGKRQDLMNHLGFLQNSVNDPTKAKFRAGNEQQIQAIQNALYYADNNMLNADFSAGASITILDIPLHTSSNSKTFNQQGLGKVWKMTISWLIGNNYPVEIAIQSFRARVYAPQAKGNPPTWDKNSQNWQEKMSHKISLNVSEWFNLLREIDTDMSVFAAVNGPACYNDSLASMSAYIEERKASKANGTGGYGAPAQGGYGYGAPAPVQNSGYGNPGPAPMQGGYSYGTPAPVQNGGYGNPGPAPMQGGYGAPGGYQDPSGMGYNYPG